MSKIDRDTLEFRMCAPIHTVIVIYHSNWKWKVSLLVIP